MKRDGLRATGHNGLKRVMVAALCLPILAISGMSTEAGDSRKSNETARSVYLVKYVVNGEVRYAKKPPRGKTVTVSDETYRKSNAFVCTPSGFGQKARCYVPAN